MVSSKPVECKRNERKCRNCGGVFYAFPSANKSFCSQEECKTKSRQSKGRTHGESNTRLHNIWCGMRSRCSGKSNNKLVLEYYNHVTMCDSWSDYTVFRDWSLANGYEDGLSIDRIDVLGGYSPENCRWATRSQQMRNTRKRKDAKTSKYKGVSKHSQNETWIAQGYEGGRPVSIGSFSCEIEAAKAYDQWANENYKEFARVNFPDLEKGVSVARHN